MPLKTILRAYLEMIDLGEITINEYDTDSDDEVDEEIAIKEQTPWVLHPYSNKILTPTLEAFKNLL